MTAEPIIAWVECQDGTECAHIDARSGAHGVLHRLHDVRRWNGRPLCLGCFNGDPRYSKHTTWDNLFKITKREIIT